MLIGGDKEACGSAGWIEDGLVKLWVNDFDDEVNYMTGSSELSSFTL
jgi:hypothetical protein